MAMRQGRQHSHQGVQYIQTIAGTHPRRHSPDVQLLQRLVRWHHNKTLKTPPSAHSLIGLASKGFNMPTISNVHADKTATCLVCMKTNKSPAALHASQNHLPDQMQVGTCLAWR